MRKSAVVLGFFTLVTLLITLPLATRLGTHVIGDGSDDPALAWNLWWIKHALLDLNVSPLATDYMFYPLGVNLAFYTLTLLNGALSLPLQASLGLIAAANLLLIASFVLSGFGAYLLALYVLGKHAPGAAGSHLRAAALVAAIVYAFASNKWLYASLGQFNIASCQWIPFYVLYLLRLRDALAPGMAALPRARAWREAGMAALFLALQGYAEFTFAAFLVILSALFALVNWRNVRLLAWLVVVGAVFAMLFLPILIPMLQELRVEGDIFVEGTGFAEAFSVDLLGFLVPSRLHPLLGGLEGGFAFPYINFGFVGFATLALTLAGALTARRAPSARWWLFASIAFALLSLGPDLRVNGAELALPMPFELLQALPIFKGNRYPSRFSVITMLGVAMLAGYGACWLLKRVQPARLAALALGALVLAEHWAVLPESDFRVPAFYEEIGAQTEDFTVLELPLAWRNGFRITGTLDKVFMLSQWYQTGHAKRMLSGNTSRNPELKFQYFTEAPLLNSLIALETGHEVDAATRDRDRSLAAEVLSFFGVRYVVVRPEAGSAVEPYLRSVLPDLSLWREEPGARVYRWLPPPPAANRAIEPNAPLARLFFAEGWGELGEERVWAQRSETRLLLPLSEAGQDMALHVWVPGGGQSLSVSVNGVPAGEQAVPEGSAVVRFHIPAGIATRSVDDVRLHWRAAFRTAAVNIPRGEPHPFIVAKSAGNEIGDFAHLWVDGREVSANGRGFNVAAIGGVTMPVAAASFDTFNASSESDRMADFLQTHIRGALALAVRDEASRNLTERPLTLLARLGAQARPGWRWSHAFVRVVATDGTLTLREDASPIRPAIAAFGERITSDSVMAALERIELQVPAR